MIHVYPGTAEYPLLAMLLICRRVESGKNCLRCFLDAEKFLHLALSVPESFKGLSSHKKKMCIAEENGVQWRKFAKQSALFFWNGMLIFGYFKEGIQKDTWEVNDSPTFHSDG